jgi:hypothetical protein
VILDTLPAGGYALDIMAKKYRNKLAAVIRKAVEEDGRSLYAIVKAAGCSYQAVHPFIRRQKEGLALSTASKLCDALGLKLVKE